MLNLNRAISTPLAIGIILVLSILLAGITLWQVSETKKEDFSGGKINIPEKEKVKESYIKITSPNGGEEWIAENDYIIKWESEGIENIDIFLYMPTPPPGGWPPEVIKLITNDYPANKKEYVFNFDNDYYDFAKNSMTLHGFKNPAFKILTFKSDSSYSKYDMGDENFSIFSQ